MVARKRRNTYSHKNSSFFILGIYTFFINFYSGSILWISFVIELSEKLYKISYTLSLRVF
ncbi:hypothetical protein FC695_25535 [Bacillus cereus]|uniref:Uncharacterized protein n=2 Tax=Bacillus cereus group TaxID=86661 RepID=A0A9W7QB17_BACCE|nr:hypothetical protein D7J84_27015 [Bacillus thuringiensis]KAB2388965.1 hypothetical protein F8172_24650 [Bacillus cereus]KAB2406368.1 hypothetical protein F8170_13545 [Bacillus cereus]KAB2427419.1 hypothetical protein F8168_23180 [Bacillus cereus]QCY61441.1 hypothetical protein FHE73_11810 [Bacillus thuringiensis]